MPIVIMVAAGMRLIQLENRRETPRAFFAIHYLLTIGDTKIGLLGILIEPFVFVVGRLHICSTLG